MENYLFLLIVGIIFFATLFTFLFVYIIVQRLREKHTTEKIEQYKKQYNVELYLYLIEEEKLSDHLIPESWLKLKAIEEMLTGYIDSITGDAVLSRITAYAEQYLQAHYRQQLKSYKWSTRMNVLYKIEDFYMNFLIDDVVKMLKSNEKYSKEEYFQMYKLLVLFHHEDFFYYLLHPKMELGELDYKKLLYYFDQQQIEMIIEQYENLSITIQKMVIEMIGIKYYGEFISFLESRLTDEISEIRIRSLKSIGNIGLIRDASLYLPFVHSIYWEERLMLAKLLVHVPPEISIDYLYELLKDSSWWVRLQAARSILSHKKGNETLKRVISSSDDAFAIDMAKEVLRKEK